MHELSITNAILSTVLTHAKADAAEKVHRILLVVSEISDLQPIWIRRYFQRIAAGTLAADAVLEIERQAPDFRCAECGEEFSAMLRAAEPIRCPRCGSGDCAVVSRPDYVVEEIEVS